MKAAADSGLGSAQEVRGPRGHLAGWSGRTIGGVVLVVFVGFFVVPLVWLIIAVTKSGGELVRYAPFRPGSVGACGTTGTSSTPSRTTRSCSGS